MDTGTIRATEDEALQFHANERRRKLLIAPTKPLKTQRDLSLACSPGAFPCLSIPRQPSTAFDYTPKGNFAAVISYGTAVFGLGDLAAPAAKPLMESKAALFKRFVDLD
jgi:malate dehydrogenase (oxaloacetate-decarboxylating)(NADP+)